jgi:hypothetical protein
VIDPLYNELPAAWDSFSDWVFLKNKFNRVLKSSGQLYIFNKQPMMAEIYNGLKDKFDFRFELVWNKGKGLWISNYLPIRSHELIWCFKKRGVKNSDIYFNIDAIKEYEKLVKIELGIGQARDNLEKLKRNESARINGISFRIF